MVVGDSGAESESDIGVNSVNVRKLSAVISISVGKLD